MTHTTDEISIKYSDDLVKPTPLEDLIHRLVWRFPPWFLHYDHSYLMLGKSLRLRPRKYTDYTFRPATAEDYDLINPPEVDRDRFEHRLKRGDRCLIILKGERVVCWSWSSTGKLYSQLCGHIVDMGDTRYFLYDIFTEPEERLKGFMVSCFEWQRDQHAKTGRDEACGTISVFGDVSMKSHVRMGFQVRGESYFLCLFGLKLCYYKSWPFRRRKFHVFVKSPPDDLEWV